MSEDGLENAAEALMAFLRRESSDEALVGALLLADGLACLRVLKSFLKGLSRG